MINEVLEHVHWVPFLLNTFLFVCNGYVYFENIYMRKSMKLLYKEALDDSVSGRLKKAQTMLYVSKEANIPIGPHPAA